MLIIGILIGVIIGVLIMCCFQINNEENAKQELKENQDEFVAFRALINNETKTDVDSEYNKRIYNSYDICRYNYK